MRTLALALVFASGAALAQTGHEHGHGHGNPPGVPPPHFEAVSSKSFATLMADAMAVMDEGMRRAPMNGRAEHDFITMMIPHHQGAIDMAKAVLLHTQDPALRNLALGIIAEQQNEINLMRAWLAQHSQTKGQP
ncbi:DUF305 domain-containing protein [Massilia sp. KIM]|uniref:DUF305 domain-containing protein n=1 Tax=Massilia sp. KIM TaxID=1955422 RepID=UPI001E2F8949|nr:DUF305 domain-containing protein [Massilia sp. KIM]